MRKLILLCFTGLLVGNVCYSQTDQEKFRSLATEAPEKKTETILADIEAGLASEDPEIRKYASAAAYRIAFNNRNDPSKVTLEKRPSIKAILIKCTNDSEPMVRENSWHALAMSFPTDAEVSGLLYTEIETEKNPRVLSNLLQDVGASGRKLDPVLQVLELAAISNDPDLQSTVLELVKQSDDARQLAILEKAAGATDNPQILLRATDLLAAKNALTEERKKLISSKVAQLKDEQVKIKVLELIGK